MRLPCGRHVVAKLSARGMVALVVLLCWLPLTTEAKDLLDLTSGQGWFDYMDSAARRGRVVRVWYAVPEAFNAESPVLFVMPGAKRNGAEYRDVWIPHAGAANALLLVPEFAESDYPAPAAYNLGNMVDDSGKARRPRRWTFQIIERLFDEIVQATASRQRHYLIYGHSAGAQFVQRLTLFMPDARLARAVAANSGWYTFPDMAVAFPYGIADTGLVGAGLKLALRRDLVILLGEADTDVTHPRLRATPQALRQGRHRFERGLMLLDNARQAAADLGIDLGWRGVAVPGVGHSNRAIAPAAAQELFR